MRSSVLAISLVTCVQGYSLQPQLLLRRGTPEPLSVDARRGTPCMLEDAATPKRARRWEYEHVVKPNARFLSKIIEDEQAALEQLEALLLEYPPSCPAADLPDDIFG